MQISVWKQELSQTITNHSTMHIVPETNCKSVRFTITMQVSTKIFKI